MINLPKDAVFVDKHRVFREINHYFWTFNTVHFIDQVWQFCLCSFYFHHIKLIVCQTKAGILSKKWIINWSGFRKSLIKEELDAKKVPNELSNGGTVISVPEDQVDSLKVQMAAEGLPKTGSIDYSFFGQNAG